MAKKPRGLGIVAFIIMIFGMLSILNALTISFKYPLVIGFNFLMGLLAWIGAYYLFKMRKFGLYLSTIMSCGYLFAGVYSVIQIHQKLATIPTGFYSDIIRSTLERNLYLMIGRSILFLGILAYLIYLISKRKADFG